MDYLIIDY